MFESLLATLVKADLGWQGIPVQGPNMPVTRVGAPATLLNGKVYIAGGGTQGGTNGISTATLMTYDLATGTYDQNFSTVPSSVYFSGIVNDGTYLYHLGGATFPGNAVNSTFVRIDPVTKEKLVLKSPPVARYDFHMFYESGFIYTYGGTPSNDVLMKYNIATDTWETVTQPTLRPPARTSSASVYLNGKFYLIGGVSNRSDFWEYTLSTNTWVQLSNFPITTWVGSGFTMEGRIFLMPGAPLINNNANKNIYEYLPNENKWVLFKNVANIVFNSSIVSDGKRLYCFGGSGNSSVNAASNAMYYLK